VFAELPGGSAALFSNLVSGAILLTVHPRPNQPLSINVVLLPRNEPPPPFPPAQLLNIVLLFASFSRLRFSEPELDRPYHVPFVGRRSSVRHPPPPPPPPQQQKPFFAHRRRPLESQD
jgi:hypothetical protein